MVQLQTLLEFPMPGSRRTLNTQLGDSNVSVSTEKAGEAWRVTEVRLDGRIFQYEMPNKFTTAADAIQAGLIAAELKARGSSEAH